MGVRCEDLRYAIVRPILKKALLWSPSAENLLLGTAAVESDLGYYLRQLGDGPALGIYQMEPLTHDSLWDNYLKYRDGLKAVIMEIFDFSKKPSYSRLVHDLGYATIMARLRYLYIPHGLPEFHDLNGLANYWKDHYNTKDGAGDVSKFKSAYMTYVGTYE